MAWFSRSEHPDEQLSAYVDGELDARTRAAVQSHLTACEACSAIVDELRGAKSMLAALPRQTPARSFTLGPEYAVARRREPRRSSFTFAPVAALTVLMALLFVDAAGFSGMSSSQDDGSAGGATFSAEGPTANMQAESADKDDGADTRTTDSFQPSTAGGAASGTPSPGAAAATAPDPNATPAPATAAGSTPPTRDAAAQAPEEPRPELSRPGAGEDDSGGLSTLRVLEILAALALVGSLGLIYLPRFFTK